MSIRGAKVLARLVPQSGTGRPKVLIYASMQGQAR